jgi:hypothetical protein
MSDANSQGSLAPLLAPVAGVIAATTLAIVAVNAPEHPFAGPLLSGAIAGGIAALALLGLTARRGGTPSSGVDADDLATRLARIDEHVMLSDASKRLLYRDRELDLVRMMLERDVAAGDHDAALRLVDELGGQFGRLEEAEAQRSRIESIREAEVRSRLSEGMRVIRRHLANGDWTSATAEADRLHRLLPDAPGIDGLGNQIASARIRHAAEIEVRMRDSHAEGRIDEAMRLLRELDRHLEGDEASRVVDVAQAIIVAHRDLLGRRFRDAVSEKRWPAALELGESIVHDYPNTRMAEETTALLPGIRARLSGGQTSPTTGGENA